MLDRSTTLVIVGPTASGKSGLAVKLAKKWNGEIISADSRQVYRGLDIGSGKITKREMGGVPHHLLDVASPKRVFSVAQYQKLAKRKMAEIGKRGKLPIICGGSGFYIQAVIDNLVLPAVKPDLKLRHKLQHETPIGLYEMLRNLDPERARKIDKNNPRRLIRAIEIARAIGKVPKLPPEPKARNVVMVGLNPPPEKLKKSIKIRLEKRLEAGLIAEVARLRKKGLSWKRLNELGLEYRYVAQFLQKKVGREEMVSALTTTIWRYAKRQLTWFRRDRRIHWLTPAQALRLKLNRGNTSTAP